MSIEVKHVSKTFGNYKALDNVNLKVNDGELVALAPTWPAQMRGANDDEIDDELRQQIQPAFDIGLRGPWQTHHVRHVTKQLRKP